MSGTGSDLLELEYQVASLVRSYEENGEELKPRKGPDPIVEEDRKHEKLRNKPSNSGDIGEGSENLCEIFDSSNQHQAVNDVRDAAGRTRYRSWKHKEEPSIGELANMLDHINLNRYDNMVETVNAYLQTQEKLLANIYEDHGEQETLYIGSLIQDEPERLQKQVDRLESGEEIHIPHIDFENSQHRNAIATKVISEGGN